MSKEWVGGIVLAMRPGGSAGEKVEILVRNIRLDDRRHVTSDYCNLAKKIILECFVLDDVEFFEAFRQFWISVYTSRTTDMNPFMPMCNAVLRYYSEKFEAKFSMNAAKAYIKKVFPVLSFFCQIAVHAGEEANAQRALRAFGSRCNKALWLEFAADFKDYERSDWMLRNAFAEGGIKFIGAWKVMHDYYGIRTDLN